MKKFLALLLALIMVVSLAACAGTPDPTDPPKGNDPTNAPTDKPTEAPKNDPTEAENPLAGTYDITMWVSELPGVADLTQKQIDAFEAANPGIIINASIEGVTEADAASKVINDVATAPDIYCFAQDQLARLVQASALAAPGKGAAATITENNDAGSVASASVAGTLYAYPLTADNGYYLYYNTSLFTEEDVESMEKIIEICEQNNLKFRYALENGWYTASFFFATGCHSTWTMNENGEYVSIDDDFNSANGLIAMKGMEKLAKSPAYDSDNNIFADCAAIVTGTWAATDAANYFGENLGATDLPSFEVDGTSYHLGSYTGVKLMGVKPQTDTKKAAVLSQLAQWLTNEQCQNERFAEFGWGPTNLAAQATDAVKANESLAALAKQSVYGQPQGQIHGAWWDISKLLGADAKAAESEADLQTALDEYKTAIDGLFSMSDEQKRAWSVIGSIGGTNWDTDFSMTEEPANTWTSEPIEMKAGQEFKVRMGAAWDVNFGANGEAGGANIVVEADGTYKVVFVWDGESVCTSITLVPVE